MKQTFEKSVVSLVAIPAETIITSRMVGTKRPGTGIPAARLRDVIGRKAKRSIDKDCQLTDEDV